MDAALHGHPRSGRLLFLRMLALGILAGAAIAIIARLSN
jgi:hypothetical protein